MVLLLALSSFFLLSSSFPLAGVFLAWATRPRPDITFFRHQSRESSPRREPLPRDRFAARDACGPGARLPPRKGERPLSPTDRLTRPTTPRGGGGTGTGPPRVSRAPRVSDRLLGLAPRRRSQTEGAKPSRGPPLSLCSELGAPLGSLVCSLLALFTARN